MPTNFSFIKWLPNKTRQSSIEDILFLHRINNIRLNHGVNLHLFTHQALNCLHDCFSKITFAEPTWKG